MGIYEDDIYLPDENDDVRSPKEETAEEAENKADEEKNGKDPGTRIIYQAPEKSRKREFTGFKDEEENEIVEVTEEIITDKYKGGYAFEEEMRRKNNYPQRKAAAQRPVTESGLSLEEEKKRRYIENLKAQEAARRQRAELAEKRAKTELLESDMVEIDTEERALPEEEPKKRTAADNIRLAVIVVAIIAMAASVGVLLKQHIEKKQVEAWENEVTGLIIDEPETTKKHKDKNKNKNEATTEKVLTIEEQWAQLYADYPNVKFPEGLSLKYAKLYAVNQDFVGYLQIDGLGLELPVVQSQKDKDGEYYYLRKSFYKKYSVYGCPFAQKQNDMENLDRNTIIYGHTNNSNIAFAPLNKYKTIDGFKKAPVIQFDTIYAEHKWKVVAAFITNTRSVDDDGYIFNYTFTKMQSDNEFMKYIAFIKQRSLYDTGVDIMPSDKLLTLSTCTYDFEDARFVVVARLVRPGETEDVNVSIAKVNDSPRYPQAYYKKKKMENPYKDYEKWYYSGS